MAVETFSSSNTYSPRYWTDEYGRRHLYTQQEIDIKNLDQEFKDFLSQSTLTSDDMQRLRRLSADYVVLSSQLPEENSNENDYDRTRRTILDYISSDLLEATEEDMLGLRRQLSVHNGTVITIDGQPLSTHELELMYTLIKPSSEVLDRAVEDAAYFYIPAKEVQSVESVPGSHKQEQPQIPAEYDIDYFEPDEEPSIEERHTLRDELQPITDGLVRLIGGAVISLASRRKPLSDNDIKQKIAS